MTEEKKTPPTPKTPKKAESVGKVVEVKHKENGRTFKVSKAYYEANEGKLELV